MSEEHKRKADQKGAVKLAVVTVSDTRTEETDVNARYLRKEIEEAGHHLIQYKIIKDEPQQVEATLREFADGEAQIILFNGGTGISSRDTTFDVLSQMLEKTLPGFGELFRSFSFEEVGAAAMFSRATAGVYKGRVVISVPGSPNAVEVAWTKLIKPELTHLAWEVGR